MNDLINRKAEDYNQEQGIIIAAAKVKDYQELNEYDNSGWMCQDAFDNFGLDSEDILVAFKNEKNEIEVFTYQNGGVELINPSII